VGGGRQKRDRDADRADGGDGVRPAALPRFDGFLEADRRELSQRSGG
jgi:hypothetical protein